MKLSAGQPVARLEIDELVKIKNEAEAGLNASQAAAVKAEDDFRRIDNLFTSGAVTDQQRVSAKSGADAARANVEALKATLELAKTRLGFAQLTSPIEGFVLTKSAEAGEVVQSGTTIFTVADLRDIWLTAYVNEPDLGKVKLNQPVVIKTDSFPDKSYHGKISFISQEAEFTPKQIQTTEERVKLVYRIKVTVENTQLQLKPGMPADGFIHLSDPNDTV
jgi:HlyD family secretion protein